MLLPTGGWLTALLPLPWPAHLARRNINQATKLQRKALALVTGPEAVGRVRPSLLCACAFALAGGAPLPLPAVRAACPPGSPACHCQQLCLLWLARIRPCRPVCQVCMGPPSAPHLMAGHLMARPW